MGLLYLLIIVAVYSSSYHDNTVCFWQLWVEWFGESTVSLVGRANIKSIKDGVQKRLNYAKPMEVSPNLKEAILEAMQRYSQMKHQIV